ncbi:MAG: hypothetical protein KGS61_17615, partial [Verrucomicrobia bacterium]|nr:hypothetical protein [Verrucomicrobiota bacterium]
GVGFSRPSEIVNDVILLELDIAKTLRIADASGIKSILETVARKFIRVSELAREGWQDYQVRFYSDARGHWEYRAFAFDGVRTPDNIGQFGREVRILFESVTVQKINRFTLPA